MSLTDRLFSLRDYALAHCPRLPAPFPAYTLIFSVSDGTERAETLHISGQKLDACWKDGLIHLRRRMSRLKLEGRHLRLDWVENASPFVWSDFEGLLGKIKRNFFRYGLALDSRFTVLLTEQECNANAIFYAPDSDFARFDRNAFDAYAKRRFAGAVLPAFDAEQQVWMVETSGIYCGEEDAQPCVIPAPFPRRGFSPDDVLAAGLYTGHREIKKLTPALADEVLGQSAGWLARQIQKNGRYVYGRLPCFDMRLTNYNSLRHASSLYALLECLQYSGEASLKEPAERALAYMVKELVRVYEAGKDGEKAFLVDKANDEIKLGGNGVALLALTKWRELTGTNEHLPLMELLAKGIGFMQDPETGSFVHVLCASDLSLKEKQRTIYYDGEAVFGLLRLYRQTRDMRWLDMAKKSFDSFLDDEHTKAHDHWLSYSANEITLYLPEERYFRFGINNCLGYLNFILHRETTYPTLLELIMAAQKMLVRLEALPEYGHLSAEVDRETFRRALHYRAHYLLNGFFWPEMSMFFKNPDRTNRTFFIRHHGFRARIDDVQHYISGLIAYSTMLKENDAEWAAPDDARLCGTRYKI